MIRRSVAKGSGGTGVRVYEMGGKQGPSWCSHSREGQLPVPGVKDLLK